MSNFSEQMEQIKALILSTAKSEKSFAYSTLQYLQEQSSTDESLIRSLVEFTPSILPTIIAEIRDFDSDEEIVTLALKCLGFILYHPSLVAAIPMEYVHQVLESLARLVKTTKVKVICNLGVWCISIQQLDGSTLACHFDSLLMAIVHSLDNPAGSLSTTFEGIQAVMKLSNQIGEKMRDSSSIWATPIYRRLLSADKRERDMCIRCLLKVKSLIIPSPLALSKAIAQDIKLQLLPGMKDLLKQGKKVQALQAWGWLICMLGSYSLKSRQLVNEMLKIPEQTFSDPDPQVQIATQVAWEGLIDALVDIPSEVCGAATIHQPEVQQIKGKSVDKTGVNGGIVHGGRYSKSLRLIMTPLIGIMTSKADLSVQSSCLNTWCYLLHKLDSLVNDPYILDTAVEPMFKAVFSIVLEDRNVWVWRFCINLLQDFIQSKSGCVNNRSGDDASHNLSFRTGDIRSPVSEECSLKNYPVKWLPWDFSQTDFFVRMITMAFNQALAATSCLEIRRVSYDTALKMFHMFLKGIQVDFAKPSTSYDTVMQSTHAVLAIVKMVSESALHEENATNDFQVTCLYFLEAVTQELDPSILGSPLYKVALDIDDISNLQHTGGDRLKVLISSSSLGFMDKVSPMIYLTVLSFSMVVQQSSKATSSKRTLQEAYRYFYNLLCSYDSLEVLHAVVTVLYGYVRTSSLPVWITIAKGLRDCIANDMILMKIEPGGTGSLTVCHLLLYPFVICSLQKPLCMQKCGNSVSVPSMSLEKLLLEQVREMWVSLYCLVNSIHVQESPGRNHFAEHLCSSLNCFLRRIDTSDCVPDVYASSNSQDHFLFLCADVVKSVLENVHIEKVTPEAIKFGYTGSSGINNCLELAAMLMKLLWTKNTNASANAPVLRLFASLIHLVGCLQWQEDIVCFTKALYDPLLPWLSDVETKNESIDHELQQLWMEIIKTLQRSWPAINFDSSFLKLQASVLEKTLDHPSSSISDPTIAFWNSTYGDQTKLDFPPCLLRVLDKLSRLGKIKIQKRRAPTSPTEHKSSSKSVDTHPQYKVTSTLNTCSKRVELLQTMVDDACKKKPPSCPKRKRSELTEHQKEVRRAQQGRTRDCSGHGPGIRTYTSVDFSQGNEDSQDSEDIRDPELILDLLRRVA